MNEYLVTEPVTLVQGILMLNADQAKARKNRLKALGDGKFEVIESVTFKAGEIIGYDGQLNKAQANKLESAEPEKPKPAKPEAAKSEKKPEAVKAAEPDNKQQVAKAS